MDNKFYLFGSLEAFFDKLFSYVGYKQTITSIYSFGGCICLTTDNCTFDIDPRAKTSNKDLIHIRPVKVDIDELVEILQTLVGRDVNKLYTDVAWDAQPFDAQPFYQAASILYKSYADKDTAEGVVIIDQYLELLNG